ncbi:hypothetical protein MANES_12G098060v8 [Manihot esculenta]|uniref:Uncharacterized protein n=1 Tax=Manihot esculenta TaxID=3983 RepID=A0ACB7GS48_MANES|nr:hypothetical protein MANES_12G098060v8 [Manihot esculenta]
MIIPIYLCLDFILNCEQIFFLYYMCLFYATFWSGNSKFFLFGCFDHVLICSSVMLMFQCQSHLVLYYVVFKGQTIAGYSGTIGFIPLL